MRLAAHLLIGAALAGTAQAQGNAARVDFLPIPHTMPAIMTDPLPLSGTLLRTLAATPQDSFTDPTSAPDAAEPSSTAAIAQAEPDPPAKLPDATKIAAPNPAETEPLMPEPIAPGPPSIAPPPPAPPSTTNVTVIVEGVESDTGFVKVALCDKSLSSEGCPYKVGVPAATGFVEARFSDVPPGSYAVVGYHDVNQNNEFDKMLGVPREPYALSNNAGHKMVPTFKDAALKISKGDNTVIIKLQRLLGG